jgi:hypothetical protein
VDDTVLYIDKLRAHKLIEMKRKEEKDEQEKK